jgi:signal transduction histidine kinase
MPRRDHIEDRLAECTELVATAISSAQSRADLAASRARIVTTADETRRRIRRDLHDGVQQRLVPLGFELRELEAVLPPDRELRDQLAHIMIGLAGALDDLVEITRPGSLAQPSGARRIWCQAP